MPQWKQLRTHSTSESYYQIDNNVLKVFTVMSLYIQYFLHFYLAVKVWRLDLKCDLVGFWLGLLIFPHSLSSFYFMSCIVVVWRSMWTLTFFIHIRQ